MLSHKRTVLGTISLAEMLSERWAVDLKEKTLMIKRQRADWKEKTKCWWLKAREEIARQLTADLERATDKWGIHVLRWKWTTALSFALHQGGNQGCVLGSRNATSDGRRGWGYERCKSQGDEKSWKCSTFKAKSAGDPQRGWEKGSESIDGSSLALGAEPGLPSSSIPPGWHLCWSQR